MVRKILRSLALATAIILLTAAPVLAYTYRAPVTVQSASTVNYPDIGLTATLDVAYLAANGFITATGLDTRIETASGTVLPHMVCTNKIIFADDAPELSQTNLYLTVGNTALTSLDIVPGYGGYVTRADVAAWEPAGNYEIEATCSTPGIVADSSITFTATYDGQTNIYSTTDWGGQTFTTPKTFTTNRVDVYLRKQSAGVVGNCNVTIRATTAGLPSGADLFSGSMVGDSLSETTFGYYQFYQSTPVTLTTGTVYAVTVSAPTATGAHYIWWGRDGSSPSYSGGQMCYSADGGTSWTGDNTKDHLFRVYDTSNQNIVYKSGAVQLTAYGTGYILADINFGGVTIASASTVSAGSHKIKLSNNTTNTKLYVDDVEVASGANTAVTGNASNWIIGTNVPYLSYYKHTVTGTLVGWYQPVTIIAGTALPDRQGTAEDGVITFGANPASVTVTVGGLASAAGTGTSTEDDTPPDILPPSEVSDWFVDPDVAGSLLTNPFRPLVTAVSDNTTLTEIQVWRWYAAIIIVAVMALTWRAIPNHLPLMGITGGAAIALAGAMTVFPWWSMLFGAIFIIGGVFLEARQTL